MEGEARLSGKLIFLIDTTLLVQFTLWELPT